MIWLRKILNLHVALLAVALALGVALSWSEFVRDSLAIDEHVSFWIADRSSPSTLLDRSLNYSATPPLSFVLQRLSLDFVGATEWALRLPAAVCYLATIAAVWWGGVRWLSPLAGGIAALFVAVHPSVLHVAVAGRPYGLGMLCSVLAILATMRIAERPCKWHHWSIWLVLNLALVQTHYLFAALIGAEWFVLAWPSRGREYSQRTLLAWSAALALLCLTILPGLLRVWERRLALNWTTHRPEFSDLSGLLLPVDVREFRDPVWWSVVGAVILWLVATSGIRLGRWVASDDWPRIRRSLISLAAHFVLPAGGMWLIGRYWFESLAADRYLVIYVPAGALVLGGLVSLIHGRVAPLLACLAILLLGGLGGRISTVAAIPERFARGVVRPSYHKVVDRKSIGWRGAATIADSSDVELIMVGSGLTEMWLVPAYLDDRVFHDYVSCRLGRMYCSSPAPRLSLPMRWTPESTAYFRRTLDRLARGKPPNKSSGHLVVLVCATDTDLLAASAEEAQDILRAAGAVHVSRVQYEDVDVQFYEFPESDDQR